MKAVFVVSYAVLWGWAVLSCLVLVAFARQIGVLNGRVMPVGARMLDVGPVIGDLAPHTSGTDLAGRPVELAWPRPKPMMIFFVGPRCPTCEVIAPGLRTVARKETAFDVVLVSLTGSATANRSFVKRHRLEDLTFVVSREIGNAYSVAMTPYGVTVDETGVVWTKGVINDLEQIESLIYAFEEQKARAEAGEQSLIPVAAHNGNHDHHNHDHDHA